MLRNKTVVGVTLILSCLFQLFSFNLDVSTYYQNGFMIGLHREFVYTNAISCMVPLMLPICFIFFFTGGTMETLTQGYGKILIVRDYSKTILILKRIVKNFLFIACVFFFQVCIYLPFNKRLMPVASGIWKSALMYVLVLNLLLILQCLLEIFIPAHFVIIIIFILCFISYYTVQMFLHSIAAKIVLFPSLLFGSQNEAIYQNNTYFIYLSAIIIMNFIAIFALIKVFKKVDIF